MRIPCPPAMRSPRPEAQSCKGRFRALQRTQNCQSYQGAYLGFTVAPKSQSTAWLSQIRVTGSSASAFNSQQVPISVQNTTNYGVQSCAGCQDGEGQSLCDAVHACTVINCIGTCQHAPGPVQTTAPTATCAPSRTGRPT